MAPIMFIVYVNDITKWVSSYISLFTDDAKLLKKKRSHKDWGVTERHEQDIWVEHAMDNGI